MEKHHFNQCVMILNSPGHGIFDHLSDSDYRRVIESIEHYIISTDLGLYFKKKKLFEELASDHETNWLDPENNSVLAAMLMTACDVSAVTKPWEIQREVAVMVYEEFFEQGDIERSTLGRVSGELFDRRNLSNLPKMQVDFIQFICLPLYEVLARRFDFLRPLLAGAKTNVDHWNEEQELISALTPSPFMKHKTEKLLREAEQAEHNRAKVNEDIADLDRSLRQTKRGHESKKKLHMAKAINEKEEPKPSEVKTKSRRNSSKPESRRNSSKSGSKAPTRRSTKSDPTDAVVAEEQPQMNEHEQQQTSERNNQKSGGCCGSSKKNK